MQGGWWKALMPTAFSGHLMRKLGLDPRNDLPSVSGSMVGGHGRAAMLLDISFHPFPYLITYYVIRTSATSLMPGGSPSDRY